MKWKPARVGSKFKSKIPTAIRLSCSSLLAIEESQSPPDLAQQPIKCRNNVAVATHVTFRNPIPSHRWKKEERRVQRGTPGQDKQVEQEWNVETKLRSYSRRPGCGPPVRGACACRAGGGPRFGASRRYDLRPDPPATLG